MRFDGYGESDYSKVTLNKPTIPDDEPPFYQPKGPSHYGGSFAETLSSAAAKVESDALNNTEEEGAKLPVPPTVGCGAPVANMY